MKLDIILNNLLNIIFLLFLPLFFVGLINRVKAISAGRKGPSIFQPYYDVIKLFKKGEVISHTTTFIFQLAPIINLATVIFAGLLTPIVNHHSIISFSGDFILFAYILALGKYFSILSAMDTGSSFEGMGASREINFSVLVEPAFFLILGSLTIRYGIGSFSSILHNLNHESGLTQLIILTSAISFFIMLLVEGCRVPVDDPNTHLELTMIHEVMILDNSGPDLGIIIYSAAMKIFIIASLIANILIPSNIGFIFSLLLYFLILFIIYTLIGLIESFIARLRMNHIPQFIFLMTSGGLIIFSIIILTVYGGLK